MQITRIKQNEIKQVVELIKRSIEKSFTEFYPEQTIKYLTTKLDYNAMKERETWTHFYVAKIENKIVGCGAIGPYWGSETESCLFNIFVDPDYQKQGIGKKIVQTLEQDEYFLRASRIEIPAAIHAIPFYKKLGYKHKNGELIYDDGHFALEKFNKPTK